MAFTGDKKASPVNEQPPRRYEHETTWYAEASFKPNFRQRIEFWTQPNSRLLLFGAIDLLKSSSSSSVIYSAPIRLLQLDFSSFIVEIVQKTTNLGTLSLFSGS